MNFFTSAKKLVRRNDPLTSHVAAALVNTTELEEMVYFTIRSFGSKGAIQDDVLHRHSSHPYSSITSRFKGLLDKGLIEDTGMKRTGRSGRSQRVVRAV